MKKLVCLIIAGMMFSDYSYAQAIGTTYINTNGTIGVNMGGGMGIDISGNHMGQVNIGSTDATSGIRIKTLQTGDAENSDSNSQNSYNNRQTSSNNDDSSERADQTPKLTAAQIKAQQVAAQRDWEERQAQNARDAAKAKSDWAQERKNLSDQMAAYQKNPNLLTSSQGISAGETITVQPYGEHINLSRTFKHTPEERVSGEQQWYVPAKYELGADGTLPKDVTNDYCAIGYTDNTGKTQVKVIGLMPSGNALVQVINPGSYGSCAANQQMLIPISELNSMKTNSPWKDPHPYDVVSKFEKVMSNLSANKAPCPPTN